MIYFAKFDDDGERVETYAADNMPYSYQDLKNMSDFIELSADDYEKYYDGYIRGTDGQPVERPTQELTQQPQEHEQIDPTILDLAEAVLELSAEIEKIKGGAKA